MHILRRTKTLESGKEDIFEMESYIILDNHSGCVFGEWGGEMEIFHFMSMSRSAFNDLVDLLTSYILNHPQSRDHTKASKRTSSKRIFKPRDIVAMTIRYLASVAEYKDIQSQFGAVLSCLRDCIELGMSAILTLIDHPSCSVV